MEKTTKLEIRNDNGTVKAFVEKKGVMQEVALCKFCMNEILLELVE